MPKRKPLSNEEFLGRVRDYLPMDADIRNTDERGGPSSCAIAGGMEENAFYLFDAEAVLSASHAIEELALNEATGSLLATFQDSKNFAPHRDRYWQLAATLDDVRVIGRGRKRASHDRLKFIRTTHTALTPFWTVLYQGRQTDAMLACRQVRAAPVFEQKRFIGFYTFTAGLIARVRRDIEDILAGRSSRMHEFERLLALDQAAKQVKVRFAREQQAVEAAIRRLQKDRGSYQPRHFAADLEKSLNRLRQLNTTLPELIENGSEDLAA